MRWVFVGMMLLSGCRAHNWAATHPDCPIQCLEGDEACCQEAVERVAVARSARNAEQARLAEAERDRANGTADAEAICEAQLAIAEDQEIIARERAIGRRTGVVDAVVLHDAGDRIEQATARIRSAKVSFRRYTGRDYDPAQWTCQPTQ